MQQLACWPGWVPFLSTAALALGRVLGRTGTGQCCQIKQKLNGTCLDFQRLPPPGLSHHRSPAKPGFASPYHQEAKPYTKKEHETPRPDIQVLSSIPTPFCSEQLSNKCLHPQALCLAFYPAPASLGMGRNPRPCQQRLLPSAGASSDRRISALF